MNYNQQETITKFKSNKTLDLTNAKLNKTFITNISKCCVFIKEFFLWIINKIYSFISKCSILTQFTLILIPFSILILLSIYFVHIIFFENLLLFNFYKGMKEEFLDYYITQIDDMNAEVDNFVIKENKVDIEDQLFFEVYFQELSSTGFLDFPNRTIFPNISKCSSSLYDNIGSNEKMNSSQKYTIPSIYAQKYIDERKCDPIGEFAKLYFYLFPIISYGAFKMKNNITSAFFIGYEFDGNNKNIKNNDLFLEFPKNPDNFNGVNNFIPSNNMINPMVSKEPFNHSELISNSFYKENWFMEQDSRFRKSVNLTEESYSEISLNHLNNEYNGYINKSLIISSKHNINRNNSYYIFNIIIFFQQSESNEVDYSSFIIKSNSYSLQNDPNEKYSDNETFTILKSDIIEYSLTELDYQYYHYGLYSRNYNFFHNGISYDSFNLDFLYDPLKYYSSLENFDIDLKYLSTLYLYKALFQAVKYNKIVKNREETYLLNFNEEDKIKYICNEINFQSYNEYISKSGIDCFDIQNSLYYDEKSYQNYSMAGINSKYPYCGCLPLFCLQNYKDMNKEYFNFDDKNLASKINLPNKCQNKYISYSEEKEYIVQNSTYINTTNKLYLLIISSLDIPKVEYLKFKVENLNQLPGYFLLIITQIKSSTEIFVYYYFSKIIYFEISTIIIGICFLGTVICIIIIYVNIWKDSQLIKEFLQKYELYVFHSEDGKSNEDMKNHQYKDGKENKLERHSIQNENFSLSQNENMIGKDIYNDNENTLFDDLFSMFCKHYKLSRKDVDNYCSQKKHETKYQMKLKMMSEKNELFNLLTLFSVSAPKFRLNLSLNYKMYNHSKIIKKYDQYITQVVNIDKEQTRLTQNILYELLSTENISDYGLISNLNFKYVSNIKAELKENSIQNALFINVINKMKGKIDDSNDSQININDVFLILKDGDEKQNIKLILKQKNELMEYFKFKFESDDYINYSRIESSFNFFLVNSYYKYLKQIVLEGYN